MRPSGIVMDVRLLQRLKAALSILVTLLGMFMEVKLLQFSKALAPMVVTLSGIVMDVRPLQSLKAEEDIDFVPSLMFMEVLAGIVPLYLYAI